MKRSQKSAMTRKKSSRSWKDRPPRDEQARSDAVMPSLASVAPRIKDHRPDDSSMMFKERKRLFLSVSDEVTHVRYEEWGIGVVMECMTSSVPGGTCLVRVRFQDGQLRCFNNDLDNESCCYYFGVRRYWNPTHGVDAIRSKFVLRG
ncbi:MAG: hypothetical protein WD688_02180 [Candidatus Binatia bacterium]